MMMENSGHLMIYTNSVRVRFVLCFSFLKFEVWIMSQLSRRQRLCNVYNVQLSELDFRIAALQSILCENNLSMYQYVICFVTVYVNLYN